MNRLSNDEIFPLLIENKSSFDLLKLEDDLAEELFRIQPYVVDESSSVKHTS